MVGISLELRSNPWTSNLSLKVAALGLAQSAATTALTGWPVRILLRLMTRIDFWGEMEPMLMEMGNRSNRESDGNNLDTRGEDDS